MNGGEKSILALIPLLQNRGVVFRLIAPDNGANESPLVEAAEFLGLEIVRCDAWAGLPVTQRRERLADLLKSLAPRFVHVNSLNMGRVSAPVLRHFGVPCIVHLRDIIRLNRTAVNDLNAANRLLAVSDATRRFHVAQGLNAVHVLYNGVDLAQFSPKPPTHYLHRELGLPQPAKLLAVIGQIGLRKGHDSLLDSLAPIFAQRDDVHLLIVGQRWSNKPESVQFEQNILARIQREPFCVGQKRRVHLLGIRHDIPELLNELTLLVHPARQEPLGRVLLEAAACACAVVANDVGGTREIFPNSNSALVVPVDAPEQFRRAVESVLDDAALQKSLGIAARRRAETCFDREKAAENLWRHYEGSAEMLPTTQLPVSTNPHKMGKI